MKNMRGCGAFNYKNNISTARLLTLILLLYSLFMSNSSQASIENLPNVTINLVDGTKDDTPMGNTRIHIKEILANGTRRWRKRLITNEAGQASIFLGGLNTGSSYILYARSTFNNRKKSLRIETVGTHTFRVGRPLLNITLRDAKTGNSISDTRVTAYRVETGKRDHWLGRGTSDSSGKLSLDLPALSEGATIRLRANKVYNGLHAYSPFISTAGDFDFLVGNVHVRVLDTATGDPLGNQKIKIYTRPSSGKDRWYGRAMTDSNGLLRLTLKGINSSSSTNYVLKTRSPFNNRYKLSEVINHVGEHTFNVGEPLLNVTLKDASRNGTPIADTEIRAFSIFKDSNGKERRKLAGKATTNTQGLASFDIPALSKDGAKVRLYTKAFNEKMWAKSQTITTAGNVDFNIATTVITVKDGATPNHPVLANLRINVREIISATKNKSIGHVTTDSQGVLRLTLDPVKSYLLRTKNPNPAVRHHKTSQVISSLGNHEFIVGTELLKVTLSNAITNTPLGNKRVDVYQNRGIERAKWLGRVATDTQGLGFIDVPLLSETGHSFFLKARHPYNAGNVISPAFASNSFSLDFPVGKTPVTLIDKDSASPFTNKRIDAYEKLTTGKLKWRSQGNTDSTGTVHFDLSQLALGKTHVFRTRNPFGENKKYYSALVSEEGPITFAISVDEDSPLDLKAPVISITSPASDSQVGATGFELIGTATDNNEIEDITVTINDGTDTTTQVANYDATSKQWRLLLSSDQLSADTALQVTVTASDKAQNETSAVTHYSVIADATAPTISVATPAEGDNVPGTGFLVNGSTTDDTGVTTLHARVQDSENGTIIDKDLDISSSGQWALAINNGQLTENGTVVVTLTATDVANRQTIVTLNLNVVAVNNEARHMLNRITFGATPELLDEIRSMGVDAFLNAQLAPGTIDDSAFETLLADNGEPFSIKELQVYQLNHMIHSHRQLREVMAWFWENHFNTDVNKEGNNFSYELAEHDAFRANALGNFRTLLDISAKSPAMLIYLDSILNVSSDANENYAREVMELSTCGVDACYTQDDVESLAEILTGWQVANDAFFFNANEHTPGNKIFQGTLIPEGGVEEGNTALDMLATHRATANYICSKLIQVFVSDTPNAALNARCASTFQSTSNDDDQIAQVLRELLTSPEFNSDANFNGKIKTPVEFAVGMIRSLNAQGDYENIPDLISRMGIKLFKNPVPTGWDETGDKWINSALLQERVRFVNQIANASDNSHTHINPVAFFQSRNLETAEGIVAYLLDLSGGDIWTELERQMALDILNENGTFNINANTADTQLRELIGTVQSYPEYNYQ